jgi:hypothetical protein
VKTLDPNKKQEKTRGEKSIAGLTVDPQLSEKEIPSIMAAMLIL